MIVRKKSVVTVFFLILILIAITYLISYLILFKGFIKAEERLVERNVQRAEEALSSRVRDLDTKLTDWAIWDDAYKFVQDSNPEFISSNLDKSAFVNLKINFMIFTDPSAKPVFSRGVDLNSGELIPVPPRLLAYLKKTNKLIAHPDVNSSVSGIILLPEGPLLVASRPIVTSKQEGPIRGALLFCRYLDDSEIKSLSGIIKLPLAMIPVSSLSTSRDFQKAAQGLLKSDVKVFVRVINREKIAGYALLSDIFGRPALMLSITMPREIYVLGKQTMFSFFWALLLIGIVFGFVVYLPLESEVVRRERSEQRSKHLLATTREILERMPFGVIMVGRDKKIRYINKTALKLIGFNSSDDVVGKTCHKFICPSEERSCPVLDMHLAVDTSEKIIVDNQGNHIPVLKSVLPVRIEDEDVLLETFVDISERKKAEAEVKRLYALTRSILEKLPLGVCVVNEKGGIDYVNPEMLSISGNSEEQLMRLMVFDLPAYQETEVLEKIRNVFRGDHFLIESLELTSFYSKKKVVINMSGIPFEEEGRKKALIFVEDVTERDTLAKMKTSLTHMIVHDLNNPLSGILGYITILPEELQSVISEDQKAVFETMRQAATEMMNMISDLLDIDKMEEGRFILRSEDVDLDALFTEIGDSMKIMGQSDKKVLAFDIAPGMSVWADRTILKRVISNLIGNAFKFAPSGSIITVSAHYDVNSNGLMVSVKDQGAGIPKDYLSRVFEKFVQVESAQVKGRTGKGLGLTFCKMAVEAHGGKIWVESQEGEGSTFYFVLPTQQLPAKAS